MSTYAVLDDLLSRLQSISELAAPADRLMALDLEDGLRQVTGVASPFMVFAVYNGASDVDDQQATKKSVGVASPSTQQLVVSVVLCAKRDDVIGQSPQQMLQILDAMRSALHGSRSPVTNHVWYFLNEVPMEDSRGLGGDIFFVQNWGIRRVMVGTSVN